VSITTLPIQLHIYTNATNGMANCTHPNTVVRIKLQLFAFAWHGLY